jgi:hypothetical protein
VLRGSYYPLLHLRCHFKGYKELKLVLNCEYKKEILA